MAFPIHVIDRARSTQFEQLGTKPKFWFDGGACLFKGDVRGTGADWAEVVAAHLCSLLGLPHVEYQLAESTVDGVVDQRGVICANMAAGDGELVLGNQYLLAIDSTYPSESRWKVSRHTVDAVCGALKFATKPPAEWTRDSPVEVFDALGFFIGYVMLDAWIANQDRHHENWGLLRVPKSSDLSLAPTFDHGAGMGCILTDEERSRRLSTKDAGYRVEAYCQKARSAFYGDASDPGTLTTLEAYRRFAAEAPAAAGLWLERLRAVTQAQVLGILHEVPEDRMSSVCRDFTCQLLTINQRRILASADSA
ncbi:MAG: HipA-like protein [Planctomycetes bacterium]|nr:HipA-like protein [Planctomycetota bacterium]